MKRLLIILLFFLTPFVIYSQQKSSTDVYVKEYVRKDGTKVRAHHRSAPNSTKNDNFSTRGNTNPYTGKKGWIEPDNAINNHNSSRVVIDYNSSRRSLNKQTSAIKENKSNTNNALIIILFLVFTWIIIFDLTD